MEFQNLSQSNSQKEKIDFDVITHNDNKTKLVSFETKKNTNYLLTVEISAKKLSSIGGAGFIQKNRITNDSNIITISQPLLNASNSSIPGIYINITSKDKKIHVNAYGAPYADIHWVGFVDLIVSN